MSNKGLIIRYSTFAAVKDIKICTVATIWKDSIFSTKQRHYLKANRCRVFAPETKFPITCSPNGTGIRAVGL